MLLPLLLLSLSSWSPVWEATTPNSKRIFIEVEKIFILTHTHTHGQQNRHLFPYQWCYRLCNFWPTNMSSETWSLGRLFWVCLEWFRRSACMCVRVYQWNPLGEQSTFLRENNAQCKRVTLKCIACSRSLVTACVMQTIFSRGKLFAI